MPAGVPGIVKAAVVVTFFNTWVLFEDHVKQLVEQLAGMPSDSIEAHALADRIRGSLDRLKRHLAG
jgi:hypothetical protein